MSESKQLKSVIRRTVAYWSILAVFTICLGAVSFAQAGVTPSFRGIGFMKDGGPTSHANGISGDGSTVIGSAWGPSGTEACTWTTADGFVGLGDLPGAGFSSTAYGASYDGSVVVGKSNYVSGWEEAFRWTAATGIASLGVLPGGYPSSVATDVSADGSVVTGFSNSDIYTYGANEAFRWTAGGMVGLGALGGDTSPMSEGHGISGDGSIVVGYSTSPFIEAFGWTAAEGMVGLGGLPSITSTTSQSEAISADGSTIVGQSTHFDGPEAFIWRRRDDGGGNMVGLGDLFGGSFHSHAFDVSGNGAVVVGDSWSASAFREPFVWDPIHGMRSLKGILVNDYGLDLTGWDLRTAFGVSDDGQTIVGTGVNPSGRPEGWIVTIAAPEFAIGYDYEVAGANFASVVLPEAGDDLFALFLWDGASFVFEQELAAGELFAFAAAGVSRFRILGIEENAFLDPDDPSTFAAAFTFTSGGTPDVTALGLVPEPSTVSLLMVITLAKLTSKRRTLRARK
ncbi:MAG: HAF repeat/PEP-CTERM domain-containing protein [Phycisphaerales bacterium]|jgi:probable HAF family extracellular repeat protein|nr:HAF repeat/PEP-CTERM domain-containing protein [Phycisphaerales bacterium]